MAGSLNKVMLIGNLGRDPEVRATPVSYTHLRAHETVLDLVCRLLLEKKNTEIPQPRIRLTEPPQFDNSSSQSIDL